VAVAAIARIDHLERLIEAIDRQVQADGNGA
jgi:hypothetical protein